MNLVYYCIYIYLLLKPFYIFNSGSIQPSDLFLIIAFVFLLLKKDKRSFNNILKKNIKFVIFMLCTFFINFIYFLIYYKTKFILSSMYFLFNFFAIVVFSYIFSNKTVTLKIGKILKINIIVQFIILLLGIGRWYGSSRYMGTFNDPNQFGYFILMSYMFIYLIGLKYEYKNKDLCYLFITMLLIIKCASTGMFIGLCIFLLLQFFKIITHFNDFLLKNKTKIFLCIFLIIPILSVFMIINNSYRIIKTKNFVIFSRIVEKVNKADVDNKSSDVSLIKERGYDRFIYYPQYIFYGSGEGEYSRFEKTYHQDEIHATFPSILFYYGIIPTMILLSWIYDKLKKVEIKALIPFIAIFIESFTLLNQRQVLFWTIILFLSYFKKDKEKLIIKGELIYE